MTPDLNIGQKLKINIIWSRYINYIRKAVAKKSNYMKPTNFLTM
jgi:hypothetical protein